MSNQPSWKLIANLGDASPVDYGGFFVYEDTTGVYPPEAELLISPDDDDAPEGWIVYRFILDQCTFENGILSDNKFHPELSAWFAKPEPERKDRPQDTTYLKNVADSIGSTEAELIKQLCSDNAIERAEAYRAIGEYHGFENLDSYPLTFHSRNKVEARYSEIA